MPSEQLYNLSIDFHAHVVWSICIAIYWGSNYYSIPMAAAVTNQSISVPFDDDEQLRKDDVNG